jgi:hypothetical protein
MTLIIVQVVRRPRTVLTRNPTKALSEFDYFISKTL